MANIDCTTTKICTGCKQPLLLELFSPDKRCSDGRQPKCRKCSSQNKKNNYQKNKEGFQLRQRTYYANNKDAVLASNAKSRAKNIVSIRARKADAYKKIKDTPAFKLALAEYAGANKEKKREYDKKYRRLNKEKLAAIRVAWVANNIEKVRKTKKKHVAKKIATNPAYALAVRIRAGVMGALKTRSYAKKKVTSEILGCSYPDFQMHIERQFLPGMSWGRMKEIHIDHIIPLVTAITEEDVIRLYHYSNLRPLWAVDNMKKGGKLLFLC